jgi:2-(1,2-epoxy-1,2-dihydrophenyl)acetyl-CoA isomerase
MNDTVLLARDGTVATLTLNRPDALNALDLAMVDALVAGTAEVAADDTLRVVVVQGAGKHFMAGGDIRTFATHLDEPPATRRDGFRRMVERLHAAIECLHRMPHPVIGRVHGAVARFGLSLMNACDIVVASDDAYFAWRIGGCADARRRRLVVAARLVGLRKAMEIFFSASASALTRSPSASSTRSCRRLTQRAASPTDCRRAGEGIAPNGVCSGLGAHAFQLRSRG